jgi:DNA polymerase-3 subunit delta'
MNDYNNPKKSLTLFELNEKLDFLINIYNLKNFPKVLMLSGYKGMGKFTLINHFLNFVFDKENYNLRNKQINNQTIFYKQFLNNSFPNIIYFEGVAHKNVKIDDIRQLKSTILKSSISNKERFIVLDDIELFNPNSLNALLKIIEEPSEKNYFILINNKKKKLLDTIYSRSIEVKVNFTNTIRVNIINSLIKTYNIEPLIDYKKFNITPGMFLLFNDICKIHEINLNDYFLDNLVNILEIYKKKKDLNLINMTLFLTECHFSNLYEKNSANLEEIIDKKSYVISNINKFVTFNLNKTSLINSINMKLSND